MAKVPEIGSSYLFSERADVNQMCGPGSVRPGPGGATQLGPDRGGKRGQTDRARSRAAGSQRLVAGQGKRPAAILISVQGLVLFPLQR